MRTRPMGTMCTVSPGALLDGRLKIISVCCSEVEPWRRVVELNVEKPWHLEASEATALVLRRLHKFRRRKSGRDSPWHFCANECAIVLGKLVSLLGGGGVLFSRVLS